MDPAIRQPREVFLLDGSKGSKAAYEALQLEGWHVHQEPNLDRASVQIDAYSCRVGLVRFQEEDDIPADQLQEFKQLLVGHPEVAWVALVTPAQLELPTVRELIRQYCFDYLTLPLSAANSAVHHALGHAWGMATLREGRLAQSAADSVITEPTDEEEMVGSCDAMMMLFQNIRRAARVEAPVLITGESGTGKELVAQAIHERSSRAAGPFIAVNCGALPEHLVQSELFGYEKGAFTGAERMKIGYIEAAAGGTLFLDEVGDLPLPQQVNLLRFLQEGVIERLGSTLPLPVDVRILAATHIDLENAVERGLFREDLYYRLNVLNLHPPALRERKDDIVLLAEYFLKKFRHERESAVQGFSEGALRALRSHQWPGNVRELINRVRRALVLCDNRLITASDLGLSAAQGKEEKARLEMTTLAQARTQAEIQAIQCALRETGHNISQAAKALGISRITLYRLMNKYDLNVPG